MVAPRVGAWVETRPQSWLCAINPVAPRVGAWVETRAWHNAMGYTYVAPRVGAWVETIRPRRRSLTTCRRAPRGRVG